ncbi:hypothetical protein KJ865_06960, partial [Myxococcota bacterium]|nr:hypothetical protein [Myxococcota bacterium]
MTRCILSVLLILFFTACDPEGGPPRAYDPGRIYFSETHEQAKPLGNDVDMLLVVNNTFCMSMIHDLASRQTGYVLSELKERFGRLPNLHIGTITEDLGDGGYTDEPAPSCENRLGDEGRMLKGESNSCPTTFTDYNYIVDVEPGGCAVEREELFGKCISHRCGQENCSPSAIELDRGSVEPSGLVLYEDSDGCPRCRNLDMRMEEALQCHLTVGIAGCFFKQPLEAMARAITEDLPENRGFLRESASLNLQFITSFDDCSVKNPSFYEVKNWPHSTTSSSLACFYYSHECEEDMDFAMENPPQELSQCRSKRPEDPNMWLTHTDYYTRLLSDLKGRGRVSVSLISAPKTENISIIMGSSTPRLGLVCTDGLPSPRLHAFMEYFNSVTPTDDTPFQSACANDYSDGYRRWG